jgi:chloride channel protein, CIC family
VRRRFGRYFALVHHDLSTIYSRDIQKWLLVAPLIGVVTGLLITGFVLVILNFLWGHLLPLYYRNHLLIVPVTTFGFLLTGLIMRFLTKDPNEHSTEEVIKSYHEHQGDIDLKSFWYKSLAAVATIGFGGSVALEGPSIYGGGGVGSWLWTKLRRLGLKDADRRVMLISGSAAGLGAVFRAPLTGLTFALEMPYRDDLAHEALLPSLIASVLSYATLAALLGSEPLFGFVGQPKFIEIDVAWSALLGVICGLAAMIFALLFHRVRAFVLGVPIPYIVKMLVGGVTTALCGLAFVALYKEELMPLGPNYEVVGKILAHRYSIDCLLVFVALKALATICTLGSGGVGAMFIPLLLLGGALGSVFGQAIHAPAIDLYAAVGMASFIAAGYKTPLAAVVVVAETTGGLSFLIPTLIGAAFAYAVSGEVSISTEQRLHEIVKFTGPTGIRVGQIMQPRVVGVQANATIRNFFDNVVDSHRHRLYPVFEQGQVVKLISLWELSRIPQDRWDKVRVGEIARRGVIRISVDADLTEAVRLLTREGSEQLLIVTGDDGKPAGILTDADVLQALEPQPANHGGEH